MNCALNLVSANATIFHMHALDPFDLAILRILQQDNTTPQRKIGASVHLSAPTVQRRIRRMEAEGVIAANVAQINPEHVGLPLTIFVQVELVSETEKDVDLFKSRFQESPEVQQCYYVTGEADFILVVIVESMAAYEEFTRRVIFSGGHVKKFRTCVSMDPVKIGCTLNI
ncbi:MAG: Lrp/AsnC family transcriptional regulator [Salinisphaera sp.]|jgi:Lrp/AsnC family leucine-responsive transcriptional regulator|nr:Lrp/AsnC family transcriptional regulator [Salinisphaera sp.]